MSENGTSLEHRYEKPETIKHDALNTVQGSSGYSSGGYTYYYTYYQIVLYYQSSENTSLYYRY